MSAILDDIDSRPGSATSLLRTFVGLYLRELGGWVPASSITGLMVELGVTAPGARSAVMRVKNKGLLLPEVMHGTRGYRLNPDATAMLERGDRRIYSVCATEKSDQWCLISFSVPEEMRAVRHQVRRHLHWLGCGSINNGLFICPYHLVEEIADVLHAFEVRPHAVIARADRLQPGIAFETAVGQWWDLDELARLHRQFIDTARALVIGPSPVEPRLAFHRFVTGVDAWRMIPYRDPGLASDLLPENWPGRTSSALFADLRQLTSGAAMGYVRSQMTL